MGEEIMEPKYLWTIKWTQPYANSWERPYMRHLHQEHERQIEARLDRGEYDEAKQAIARIMSL
jgi:hypothetical protein